MIQSYLISLLSNPATYILNIQLIIRNLITIAELDEYVRNRNTYSKKPDKTLQVPCLTGLTFGSPTTPSQKSVYCEKDTASTVRDKNEFVVIARRETLLVLPV